MSGVIYVIEINFMVSFTFNTVATRKISTCVAILHLY